MEKESNHGRAWRNRVIMDVHGETESSWTCMEKESNHGCARRNRVIKDLHGETESS